MLENQRKFTREDMLMHWEVYPEDYFRNNAHSQVTARIVDGHPTVVIPALFEGTIGEEVNAAEWTLVEKIPPQPTRGIVYAKSYFVVEHPLLSKAFGWKWEDKMFTPNQFASMVMSVRYPTDQLSDILDNALWYEIDTIENIDNPPKPTQFNEEKPTQPEPDISEDNAAPIE